MATSFSAVAIAAQPPSVAPAAASSGWVGAATSPTPPTFFPSDDQEINRLDFQHYMLRYALRGNYAAPLNHPATILHVGSGTGRWAYEMAALFPETRIVGTDLVAPKPDASGPLPPPNYTLRRAMCWRACPSPTTRSTSFTCACCSSLSPPTSGRPSPAS